MRIYTEVIIDIATGAIRFVEYYDYQGSVALLKGGGGSAPPPPPPPPYDDSAEVAAAAAEARRIARRRSGRSSTIRSDQPLLTAGVFGQKKKLFGS